jgi:penicillin-binding protein 1A
MDDTAPSPPPAAEPAPTAAVATAAAPGRLRRFRRSRAWRIGRWPVFAGVALSLVLVTGFAVLYVTVELPDDPPQLQSSVILDASGNEIAVLQKDGLRVAVDLDDVAPVAIDALLAAEDRRFYDHDGIDPVGIGRAFVSNLRGGGTQGGSTLTQQLVKNSYLGTERTVTRKVREAVLSIKLEQRADKDDILDRYLNTVYFGRGTYGIEAAANVYFDTTAAELDLHEAALLVGLLRAPETADPELAPDEATRRRDTVLSSMAATGAVTAEEAEAARDLPLGATDARNPVTLTAGVAAHFVEWVRADAIERFGAEVVYGGGLRITTTLDLADQQAAEMTIAGALDAPDDPQAGLVSLDRSGAIRAYVGGRDFDGLQVDLVRGAMGGGTGRQPGSTFKTFVLATALEQGIPLGTTYPAPATTTIDTDEGPYEVANYGRRGFGTVDLVAATADSVNTAYAHLAQDVGPEEVVDMAGRLGVTTEMAPNASLVLGTSEVSVLDMANAYLTLAREGDRVEPWAIARIEDPSGRVLFEAGEPDGERVLDEEPARAVTHALQQVIEDGTGTAARLDRPAAGKTGTTQGHGDAWFAGYTPDHAAVVWLGYPEGSARPMDDVHGGPVTGGGIPARIWQGFMSAALVDVEPAEFTPPPDELLERGQRPSREQPDWVMPSTGSDADVAPVSAAGDGGGSGSTGRAETDAPPAAGEDDGREGDGHEPDDTPAGDSSGSGDGGAQHAPATTEAPPPTAAPTTTTTQAPATTTTQAPAPSTTTTTAPVSGEANASSGGGGGGGRGGAGGSP